MCSSTPRHLDAASGHKPVRPREEKPIMEFAVASAKEASAVVEYFNAFHDGFIRRFTLISHDTFEDRDTHVTTGPLDLEILLAHANYRDGRPPFDQAVHARFGGVRDLRVAFTGRPTDWPITSLHLEGDATSDSTVGQRLRARLIQPRLVDNSSWEHVESVAFTFDSAEFRELGGG
jgi:hypothetical protein